MNSLFFSTHEDRVARARNLYFEEGTVPSGAVNDAVLQSWASCMRAKRSPHERVEFQPVTQSRAHLALQKNAHLCQAWEREQTALQSIIGATGCDAVLTDASGVLIGVAGCSSGRGSVLNAAHRIGVNLSEEAVGTTAPGIVLRTGKQALVRGAEHYFDRVGHMHCAAAPIRDIHGRVTAVLDISSEGIPFRFDVTSVLGYFATALENRLVVAQAQQHLILKFQISSALLDTPLCAMAGIGFDGRVEWLNSTASSLLGLPLDLAHAEFIAVEQVFGCKFSDLASLRNGERLIGLPNGLSVYVKAELFARDGCQSLMTVGLHGQPPVPACGPSQAGVERVIPSIPGDIQTVTETVQEPAAMDSDATLRDADMGIIAKALTECDGNISAVARKLKVSRGLIYRHINASRRGR